MDSTCRRSTESRMTYTVDENGCHVWQKALSKNGYGVIWHDGKVRLAHRVAFYFAHGRWPADGLVVDHICNNKACVNADHLREIPNWQNLRRAVPRGDEETELRRARWRRANAKRRGNYTYTEGR